MPARRRRPEIYIFVRLGIECGLSRDRNDPARQQGIEQLACIGQLRRGRALEVRRREQAGRRIEGVLETDVDAAGQLLRILKRPSQEGADAEGQAVVGFLPVEGLVEGVLIAAARRQGVGDVPVSPGRCF